MTDFEFFFRVTDSCFFRLQNTCNVPENLSVDQLSNRSLKSRTERMAKKLSTCVANQRGPFFHSTWAYDFILEKREKKGHIFVRDQ